MIVLEGVSKKFGSVSAVEDVSLQAFDRQILVLLGTSGCGKTTTLKMINRLVEPDEGNISINGIDVREKNPEALRMGIGYVMQHAGLFPHYTVEENIAIVPNLLKWDKKCIQKRREELMEKLHLPETILKRFPNELSGGQQQRVGIVRALMVDTPVLLMDEPFGALDNITKSEIHKEFKSLQELKNKTIIMVTHDVQEAFELADRICLMDKGRVIQLGTTKEILYQPANVFVRDFFAANRLLLEYKITKLSDLFPDWEKAAFAADIFFDFKNTSVWEALQQFSAQQKYAQHFQQLTEVFNHYRKGQSK